MNSMKKSVTGVEFTLATYFVGLRLVRPSTGELQAFTCFSA